MEIPLEIHEEESLGRIILHSLHYSESKNKIRPEAFIPSPNEIDEISVLRYMYTNANFCKRHGLKIAQIRNHPNNPCKFIGVAFLFNHEINTVSAGSTEVSCQAIASPYDENNNRRTDPQVFTEDLGLPMHADIKYSMVVEQDKPIRQLVKQHIVKKLCAIAQNRFFKDTEFISQDWVGEAIQF